MTAPTSVSEAGTSGLPPFATISVVGLGTIGLPTAAAFAGRRLRVVGVDVDPHAVDTVNRNGARLTEPDLDILLRKVVAEGYLRATRSPEPADAFLIAVPTPFRKGGQDLGPDLSCIAAASRSITPVLKAGDLVVLESTSPVGTTAQMATWLAELRPDLTFPQTHGEASDIRIAHCPERVLPGRVLRELVQNDRVIGGMTARCSARTAELYRLVVEGDCLVTTPETAEMTKLAENSFRDVNIAFANELSVICGELGIDVRELIALANRHPRVNVLKPGPGVGGHCIAVDPWFIVNRHPDAARLIRTAREINDAKPAWVLDRIERAVIDLLGRHPDRAAAGVTIACWGLAFKPDVGDLRQSPALEIVRALSSRHPGQVLVVEPHAVVLPEDLARTEHVALDAALERADLHVALVDHAAFRGAAARCGRRLLDFCGASGGSAGMQVPRQ